VVPAKIFSVSLSAIFPRNFRDLKVVDNILISAKIKVIFGVPEYGTSLNSRLSASKPSYTVYISRDLYSGGERYLLDMNGFSIVTPKMVNCLIQTESVCLCSFIQTE